MLSKRNSNGTFDQSDTSKKADACGLGEMVRSSIVSNEPASKITIKLPENSKTIVIALEQAVKIGTGPSKMNDIIYITRVLIDLKNELIGQI